MRDLTERNMQNTRTRTLHNDIEVRVKVQNKVFRELGRKAMTGSWVDGSGGDEASRLAAEVGKYMSSLRRRYVSVKLLLYTVDALVYEQENIRAVKVFQTRRTGRLHESRIHSHVYARMSDKVERRERGQRVLHYNYTTGTGGISLKATTSQTKIES